MRWNKVHLNTFFLSEMFHHKVLDQGFRVSTAAPSNDPSESSLVISPARKTLEKLFNEISILMAMLPSSG